MSPSVCVCVCSVMIDLDPCQLITSTPDESLFCDFDDLRLITTHQVSIRNGGIQWPDEPFRCRIDSWFFSGCAHVIS